MAGRRVPGAHGRSPPRGNACRMNIAFPPSASWTGSSSSSSPPARPRGTAAVRCGVARGVARPRRIWPNSAQFRPPANYPAQRAPRVSLACWMRRARRPPGAPRLHKGRRVGAGEAAERETSSNLILTLDKHRSLIFVFRMQATFAARVPKACRLRNRHGPPPPLPHFAAISLFFSIMLVGQAIEAISEPSGMQG